MTRPKGSRHSGGWARTLGVALLIAASAGVSTASQSTGRHPKDTDDMVFEQVPPNQLKPPALEERVAAPPEELVPPFTPSNVNVSNLVGNEAEVSIAINPTNPQNMVIVGHSPGAGAMNTFFTQNGGQTWTLVALGQAQDGQAN